MDQTIKVDDMNINDTQSSDDAKLQAMNSVQQHRRQILADGCREYADVVNKPKAVYWQAPLSMHFYDDQLQYVYCRVPKVANTNWRRTLIMLTGKLTNYSRPEQIPFELVHEKTVRYKHIGVLNTLLPDDSDWRLRKYFKFIFVREPLERLLSAFRDKLLFKKDDYKDIDVDIVQKYRPREYRPSVKRYNVTFAEFVRYVLDEHAAGSVLDRHWLPQSKVCSVCEPLFEFIGHYETLDTDVELVVSKLKSRVHDQQQRRQVDHITFPSGSSHTSKTNGLMKQMYSTIPAQHIQALYKLYAVDYALFGYEHPNVTGFY